MSSKWYHTKAFSTKRDANTERPHEENWVTATTVDNKRGIDIVDLKSSQQTSYGVQETVTNVANIRTAPVYNLIPANFRTFTGSGGSATAENREFKCSSGTTIFGYGAIQSFRSLTFEYGQTAVCRFAARFPDATALTWLGVGMLSITDEVAFGRNGTDFGIWHRYGGEVEVRTIQVTGAAGGSENATVTVNGTGYTVPLTAGTFQHNAKEIADYLSANATGYAAEQLNDSVIVSALSDGAKSDTWSFSSSTATATITRNTPGVTKTSDFVAQADFNGTVPTGFDPTKGNLYSISWGAGYSDINYRIYDTSVDRFILAHQVAVTNNFTRPNFNNPSLRTGLYAYSIGATTDTSTYCSFISAASQGTIVPTRNPRAFSNTKSIGTTLTNLFTIRNKRIYNNVINQSEIIPLELTIANETNKAIVVEVRGNPTVAGTTNFQDIGTNLIAESEIAGTTVTQNGRFIASITVAPASEGIIDLASISLVVPPTLRIVVAVRKISGTAGDVTGTLVWREDI